MAYTLPLNPTHNRARPFWRALFAAYMLGSSVVLYSAAFGQAAPTALQSDTAASAATSAAVSAAAPQGVAREALAALMAHMLSTTLVAHGVAESPQRLKEFDLAAHKALDEQFAQKRAPAEIAVYTHAVLQDAERYLPVANRWRLMHHLIAKLYAEDQSAVALPTLILLYAEQSEKLAPTHPDFRRAAELLPEDYHKADDLNKSRAAAESRAFARTNRHGAEPSTHSNLEMQLSTAHQARMLKLLGHHDKALPLEEKVLACRLDTQGTGPSTLSAMSTLALTYSALGQYPKALALHEKVLNELPAFSKNPRHRYLLTSQSSLALTYSAMGRHEEARALNEQVWANRSAELGAEHSDTLMSGQYLADSYSALTQHAQALALHQQILATRTAKLGAAHPLTLSSATSLALSHSAAGQHDQALALAEKIWTLRSAKLGPSHVDTRASHGVLDRVKHQANTIAKSSL